MIRKGLHWWWSRVLHVDRDGINTASKTYWHHIKETSSVIWLCLTGGISCYHSHISEWEWELCMIDHSYVREWRAMRLSRCRFERRSIVEIIHGQVWNHNLRMWKGSSMVVDHSRCLCFMGILWSRNTICNTQVIQYGTQYDLCVVHNMISVVHVVHSMTHNMNSVVTQYVILWYTLWFLWFKRMYGCMRCARRVHVYDKAYEAGIVCRCTSLCSCSLVCTNGPWEHVAYIETCHLGWGHSCTFSFSFVRG
jgi:hypothetical protein